jgi:hypothetical protein
MICILPCQLLKQFKNKTSWARFYNYAFLFDKLRATSQQLAKFIIIIIIIIIVDVRVSLHAFQLIPRTLKLTII